MKKKINGKRNKMKNNHIMVAEIVFFNVFTYDKGNSRRPRRQGYSGGWNRGSQNHYRGEESYSSIKKLNLIFLQELQSPLTRFDNFSFSDQEEEEEFLTPYISITY